MTDNERQINRLHVSLDIERLKDISGEIRSLQDSLEVLRSERDEILIELAEYIPITKLARLAGLTRERVTKIASPRSRMNRED